MKKILLATISCFFFASSIFAEGTRLLRQPTISDTHIAFTYGGDIWITELGQGQAVRITSTPAVESDPHFSPDGKIIAFTSNRSGIPSVYTVPVTGGTPTRLSWYPAPAKVVGWSVDGKQIIYASTRETAPAGYDRLWTVSVDGGPSTMLAKQWATDGSYSADGKQIVINRVRRWDKEWRAYRGGQNTPLIVLDLETLEETLIPNEKTTDIQPLWLGETIYFLSDRDWCSNIWSYSPATKELNQITHYTENDIKWLSGKDGKLAFERDGFLNILDLKTNKTEQLNIAVVGDFPWAETQWEDVGSSVRSASLSPTGKRAVMQARGEIFTIPAENGDTRNLTQSSDAADRAPLWSPKGDQIAWFSDAGGEGYQLMLTNQDGLSEPTSISIGESKMAWDPEWSPDGKYIAFIDDDVRLRVVDLEAKTIKTADSGGNNLERGATNVRWSPDSKWIAYSKTADNGFRQIKIWSLETNEIKALTNVFADSYSPSWDRDGKHLYFLASTDLALGSSWANTSSMISKPNYGVYVVNLCEDDDSPFKPKSDEEPVKKDDKGEGSGKDKGKKKDKKEGKDADDGKDKDKDKPEVAPVKIDFDGIERRTMALPMKKRDYKMTIAGPKGTVFISESKPNSRGLTLQKFTLEKKEAKEFVSGAGAVSVSADGKKMLARMGGSWKIMDTTKPSGKDGKGLKLNLQMKLDRSKEWAQIFNEAWRYERDYFYDPNMHGRNWDDVYSRYSPLLPFVKHRADLTYVLDQINGELSVGHSFVFGGDYPKTESNKVGLLGANLIQENKRWKIKRIFTTESWNPELAGPLDQPGLKVEDGNYLVGINGEELTANDNPYKLLDGTVGRQTVLHINKEPKFEEAWKIIVKPIGSEGGLRQRTWVEDNRRMVDSLSNGQLAYVWVPNTSNPGFISFNRYYFAQQDKKGAVIDERFNGGGLLDDYMVDIMNRSLRAALTNEVPNGKPMRLPAGITGPKVLLINEMAGSGGDFFPWVFRHQKTGKLIGATTWGGLVKSSVHYGLVDGGALTAPDNAVFDPVAKEWVGENKGIAPDIAVRQDAKSLQKGVDPQLERAVKELLKQLEGKEDLDVSPPPFSTPAIKK